MQSVVKYFDLRIFYVFVVMYLWKFIYIWAIITNTFYINRLFSHQEQLIKYMEGVRMHTTCSIASLPIYAFLYLNVKFIIRLKSLILFIAVLNLVSFKLPVIVACSILTFKNQELKITSIVEKKILIKIFLNKYL